MKKTFAWALSLILALSAAGALAQAPETVFDRIAGLSWSFSSGVGAWSTDLTIRKDGTFRGEFHDGEMGETGEGYPDGTVYGCLFSGKMTQVEQVDENTWKLRVDSLVPEEGQVPEVIEDGVRYVTSEPYGLSEGDEMLLYAPGTPLSVFDEDMVMWTHALEQDDPPAALETWFLSSEKNGSGFVGYPEEAAMPNPWQEMTAEELEAASGLRFAVPQDARQIVYRYLAGEHLAEMQFTLDDDEFCARVQPAALQEGELMNISGIYMGMEYEEPITVGHCAGTIGLAQTGSQEWVELCLWYDPVPGLMYSLSVYTIDPDGLDLTTVAQQTYVPVQGDN